MMGVVVVDDRATRGLSQPLETPAGAHETGETLDRTVRIGAREPRGLQRGRRVQRVVRARHLQLDLVPAPLEVGAPPTRASDRTRRKE